MRVPRLPSHWPIINWRTSTSSTAPTLGAVKSLLENLDGVAEVLGRGRQTRHGLDHPRSGELVALANPDRWFSYYWWLDDAKAPDFARTVDIHRKPGYDPMELFLDPHCRAKAPESPDVCLRASSVSETCSTSLPFAAPPW